LKKTFKQISSRVTDIANRLKSPETTAILSKNFTKASSDINQPSKIVFILNVEKIMQQ